MTANTAWNILNFRQPLISSLLEDGHRISVLAPQDEAVAELERLGCRFVPLHMVSRSLNPFGGLYLLWQYLRFFRAERPDIVLSYTIKNNIFGAFAARLSGTPFIPNVTGLGTAFLSSAPVRFIAQHLYRLTFSHLPVVFFQNHDDRDLFLDLRLVGQSQCRTLPGSGIDLERFAVADYPDGPDPVFLMISRLIRDKGVLEFVDAARLVKSVTPAARFQLLGPIDGNNRTAVTHETVRRWVEDGAVEYLGTTDDVRPAISRAQCVVLPSYREGAPRTLIEASAMARPLIATDVPGCRSVVDRDVNGFLCEVRSSESLAESMAAFLQLSRQDRIAMGLAGRSKMEREFSQAIVVRAYRDAIAALVPAMDHHSETARNEPVSGAAASSATRTEKRLP